MNKKLGKGIIIVFIANIINLLFNLATNFLLPKYLSVDSYAEIKTFQLYISYVGLLHLGYIDSVYLKYGGKNINESQDESFYTNKSTLSIFQIFLTLVTIAIAIVTNNIIFMFFAFSILPLNMNNYFKFLYQATGEFKLYSRIMNYTTASTFAANMVLLFIFRKDNSNYYIVSYCIVYYAIWIMLELKFRKEHKFQKGIIFSATELITNIKDGILLTVGNLASTFLTSMDRWFVHFLMTMTDFAQYSFAVSMESFLNVAVIPITTTLYNFFCKEQRVEEQRKIYNYILIFATILPCAAFPAKIILRYWLTNYIAASKTIFILFSSQMFYIIIKSVYVNLYKVNRQQKTYFNKLVLILIIGFVFNACFYYFVRVKESFSVGTLLSAIIWFILSSKDYKYLHIQKKNYIYLFVEMAAFLIIGLLLEPIVGMLIYLAFSFTMIMIFMRDSMQEILLLFKNKLKKNKG